MRPSGGEPAPGLTFGSLGGSILPVVEFVPLAGPGNTPVVGPDLRPVVDPDLGVADEDDPVVLVEPTPVVEVGVDGPVESTPVVEVDRVEPPPVVVLGE